MLHVGRVTFQKGVTSSNHSKLNIVIRESKIISESTVPDGGLWNVLKDKNFSP